MCFFHITWAKPVRIHAQTPTLHPTVIDSGSKSVTTEKKTQTGAERLTYAVSKTCWCLLLCSVSEKDSGNFLHAWGASWVFWEQPKQQDHQLHGWVAVAGEVQRKESSSGPKEHHFTPETASGRAAQKLPWIVLLYWGLTFIYQRASWNEGKPGGFGVSIGKYNQHHLLPLWSIKATPWDARLSLPEGWDSSTSTKIFLYREDVRNCNYIQSKRGKKTGRGFLRRKLPILILTALAARAVIRKGARWSPTICRGVSYMWQDCLVWAVSQSAFWVFKLKK